MTQLINYNSTARVKWQTDDIFVKCMNAIPNGVTTCRDPVRVSEVKVSSFEYVREENDRVAVAVSRRFGMIDSVSFWDMI